MTDWLPWGLVVMTGLFGAIGLLLRAVRDVPGLDRRALRRTHIVFWVTVVLSYATYSLYLVVGERWIWYLK